MEIMRTMNGHYINLYNIIEWKVIKFDNSFIVKGTTGKSVYYIAKFDHKKDAWDYVKKLWNNHVIDIQQIQNDINELKKITNELCDMIKFMPQIGDKYLEAKSHFESVYK